MNSKQFQLSTSILKGMGYLAEEAESNDMDQIGRILRMCIRDISIAIELAPTKQEERLNLNEDDFLCARKFLTRFLAFTDDQATSLLSKYKNKHATSQEKSHVV